MDLGLTGKVAIVGGASMGIGYGIARQLAREGARVVITARREPGLSTAAEALRSETGAEVLAVQADCRRAEDCARVVATTLDRFGGIDALVNNDGAPPL
ncbi:MAG TPA: SDR family NAD(P)-dependent oxidoreductase, partial [Hyphomicrobiaceae bacterium]|nr:SDR family NAD(P)-dependent oxidoreductase [Hyphomicrobiaceae bacterium]